MASRGRRNITPGELIDALMPDDAAIRKGLAPRFGVQFRRNMRANFASQGTSGGDRWAPLSASYERWKRQVKPGRKILVFSGALRSSLTSPSNADHILRVVGIDREQSYVTMGTRDPKAEWHHKGTDRMPRRDPIQQTDEQKARYEGVLVDWLRPRFRAAARRLAALTRRRKGRRR